MAESRATVAVAFGRGDSATPTPSADPERSLTAYTSTEPDFVATAIICKTSG
jgi:hypothetical protein